MPDKALSARVQVRISTSEKLFHRMQPAVVCTYCTLRGGSRVDFTFGVPLCAHFSLDRWKSGIIVRAAGQHCGCVNVSRNIYSKVLLLLAITTTYPCHTVQA